MLLLITGASGAGKSTVLEALSATAWDEPVICFEFDSIGVPDDADTAWRHWAIEQWVRRALEEQTKGNHFMIAGQVPIGELLAAPSADRLDRIAACMLDCSAEVRRARLRARGEPEVTLDYHVSFGEWFRGHFADPQYRTDVIQVESPTPMRWDRWEDWASGDPRWPATIIDTDCLTGAEAATQAGAWARAMLGSESARVAGT